ncbi:hypothetical protein Pcinc_031263 [Petrolisthes cinctipes]|uniref:Uncharacterized protein n=1 Tax=Petrolisthes cinctipes TaxID=88211 RepID=A0AAE1EX06_PETCI|nr:hypothetical protein Pcinc_031263 [Petrolisthes cinctipes]
MKWSGRVMELNYIFLLVVTLLVALQVYLQRTQQRLELNKRSSGSEGEWVPVSVLDKPENTEDNAALADPLVPNIRKSFPKRRAPYVRKGKNKKRKNKNKLHKQDSHWEGKGGGEGKSVRVENGKEKASRKENGKREGRDGRMKDGRVEEKHAKWDGPKEGKSAGKGKVSFKQPKPKVGNDHTKHNKRIDH